MNSPLRTYNAQDNVIQRRLYDRHYNRLYKEIPAGLKNHRLLTRLQVIGDEMCWRGLRIDPKRRKFHIRDLSERIKVASIALAAFAKRTRYKSELNPASAPQLRAYFFNHLGAKPTKFSESTNEPSLDESVLTSFLADPNPIVVESARQLLEIRRWGNLLRNHVRGLPVIKGIVHPFWRPGGTQTGRWSSSQPNVMNVPKPIEDTVDGERVITHYGVRDMYQPIGTFWLECDYKQIEMRIVSLLSNDTPSLRSFANNEDPHSANAWDLFHSDKERPKLIDKSHVTKKERTLAKNFCYLANYGGDAHKLWETIVPTVPTFTVKAATHLLKKYFKAHPAIKRWQDTLKDTAQNTGYVDEPLSGKRRYFWGPVKPSEVYNYPVQTAASHIINIAIQRVNRKLKWPNEGILMQLHDALHVDGPDPYRLGAILQEQMNVEVELRGQRASFPVDLSIGTKWATTEEMSLDDIKSWHSTMKRTSRTASATRAKRSGTAS